jgi:isopentenyl phosphate kinase
LRQLDSRELMEILVVSHAHAKQDNTSMRHLEEIEDGVMQVLQEHRDLEQIMIQHMLSVCVLPIILQPDFPFD